MTRARRTRQAGITLPELLIALVIFSVVMGATLALFRSQMAVFRHGTQRMSLVQTVRFTMGLLERELRTAGNGVLDVQPSLVYAGPDAVAFNADYATNVTGDVFAVYFDPDAPAGAVTVMTRAQRTVLPGTGFAYPDTTYRERNGANGPAETIAFFFTEDTSTIRRDDHALYRQVNDLSPELVSRNLLRTGGRPFFTYERLVLPVDSPARLEEVPADSLPMAHTVALHGSPADTGTLARIDSIRSVRVTFTATDGLDGPREQTRSLSRLIGFPNLGLTSRHTCGDAPMLGSVLGVAAGLLPDGRSAALLTWDAAIDEAGGEGDVVRYVLWRRFAGEAEWGDPYLSIPAGNATYAYADADVETGRAYEYALAAQDCTPSMSVQMIAGPTAIP